MEVLESVRPKRATKIKKRYFSWKYVAIIVAVVIVGISLLTYINRDKWVAVYTNNNYVYFGTMDRSWGGEITLYNVYYIEDAGTLIDKSSSGGVKPDVSIIELGSEVHAPVKSIHLSRNFVNSWEELRSDSSLLKALQAKISAK